MAGAVEAAQLRMAGMPEAAYAEARPADHRVEPGQIVFYLGRVVGGPKYGGKGVVIEARRRVALVDLGPAGVWQIPYYFLAVPLRLP